MISAAQLRRPWLRFGLALAVLLGLIAFSSVPAQPLGPAKSRIDPAGIDGALILTGKDLPTEAVQRFVQLAGGKEKKARIVVVRYFDTEKMSPDAVKPEQQLKNGVFKDSILNLTIIDIGWVGGGHM